eukprot:g3811.t1
MPMPQYPFLVFFLTLTILLTSSNALFEDEAGQIDWSRKGIGDIALVTPGSDSHSYYVASSGGVLAKLKRKTGEILWRQVFPRNESIQVLSRVDRVGVLTVSMNKMVRLFDDNGDLLWDTVTHSGFPLQHHTTDVENTSSSPKVIDAVYHNGDVLIVSNTSVVSLSSDDGEVKWVYEAPEGVTLEVIHVVHGNDCGTTETTQCTGGIYVAGRRNSKLFSVELSAADGDGTSLSNGDDHTLTMEGGLITLLDGSLAFLNKELSSVIVQPFSNSSSSREEIKLPKSLQGDDIELSSIHGVDNHHAFVVRNKISDTSALLLLEDNKLNIVHVGESNTLYSSSRIKGKNPEGDSYYILAGRSTLKRTEFRLFDLGDSLTWDIERKPYFVSALNASLNGARLRLLSLHSKPVRKSAKKSSSPRIKVEHEVLVSCEDFTFARIELGRSGSNFSPIAWQRHEALHLAYRNGNTENFAAWAAPVTSHLLFSEGHKKFDLSTVSFMERVIDQMNQLLRKLKNISHWLVSTAKLLRWQPDQTDTEWEASLFGFDRLLFLLTPPGKLFALNGSDGSVAWSSYIPGAKRLYVDNVSETVIVVLYNGKNLQLSVRDMSLGKELIQHNLPSSVKQILPFVEPSTKEKKVERPLMLLLVDVNRRVSIFVNNAQGGINNDSHEKLKSNLNLKNAEKLGLSLLKEHSQNIFFQEMDSEEGIIKGFALKPVENKLGKSKKLSTFEFEGEEIWSINAKHDDLGSYEEEKENGCSADDKCTKDSMYKNSDIKIVAVASAETEPVHSPARALGDDSLLLKHVNPHITAIVSVRGHKNDSQEHSITVRVVDGVTGRILLREHVAHGAEPVSIQVSENWVVFSYYNARAKRTEIGTVALYEGAVPKFGLNPFTEVPTEDRFSSWESPSPVALHKTYVYPVGVATIGQTSTRYGVTTKHLLVATQDGKLAMIHRNMLNPRRPETKPTKNEQKEQLLQYHPALPFPHHQVISYSQTVSRANIILASPTHLESTSLVATVGLDIFCTRLKPSGGFDQLPKSFNKPMLALLVSGLATGTLWARAALRRKKLNEAWK